MSMYQMWQIRCSGENPTCWAEDQVSGNKTYAWHEFKASGWTRSKGQHFCANCTAARKKRKTKMKRVPNLPEGTTYFADSDGRKICTGSSMGCPDTMPDDPEAALELVVERLPWVDGDYTPNGSYWGFRSGTHIYRATCCPMVVDLLVELYVRAKSFSDAEAQFKEKLPNAKFVPNTFVAADFDNVIATDFAHIHSSLKPDDTMMPKLEDFDDFTMGYIEAAIWLADEWAGGGDYLGTNRSGDMFKQIDLQTLQRMHVDCQKFQKDNEELLRLAEQEFGLRLGSAGHDFWLERNGTGCGFRDRRLEEVGEQLHDAAKKFPYIEGLMLEPLPGDIEEDEDEDS